MKTMYRCEKCGKTSENYDEIAKCEQMHFVMPRPWYDVNGLAEMLDSMTEYKEGQEEPNIIHVMYNRSYWDGEEWKEEKRCGKYKLISSYATPAVVESET